MVKVKKYDDGGSVDNSIPKAPPEPLITNPTGFGPPGYSGSGGVESKEPIPDWVKKEEKRQGMKRGGPVKKSGSKKPGWRRW